ncbi:ribosome recycling factor [Chrysiogenes arsenatis]|uniref:ribosome recycling factor n=1 Tax=Chrysiogenes arsenatis TaxID=309797 RepID=UPI000410C70B|nr:ribosome recycling factor [Chrysiogenes arsenatis]
MVQDIYTEMNDKMTKAVEATKKEFTTLRTGRASTNILDSVRVNYYGNPSPLSQIGTVTVSDATTLLITPWESNIIAEVEKAIMAANLGLTPGNDGKTIRLSVPPLTEERRKDLAKQVKKFAEEGKVAIRNIRRHGNDLVKELEKDKTIAEDQAKKAQDEIQKITDGYSKKIDDLAKAKELELMKV